MFHPGPDPRPPPRPEEPDVSTGFVASSRSETVPSTGADGPGPLEEEAGVLVDRYHKMLQQVLAGRHHRAGSRGALGCVDATV